MPVWVSNRRSIYPKVACAAYAERLTRDDTARTPTRLCCTAPAAKRRATSDAGKDLPSPDFIHLPIRSITKGHFSAMAEPNDTITVPPMNGEDTSPAIGMISQYVKDFSFENPNSPAVYQWQEVPQVDVQFNISAQGVGDNLHEVVLKVEVSAASKDGTLYVVDLSYAGLFGVRNVPEDQLHPFFYAEAPRILFPFARRIIADAVRDASFPPMLLEPIDFHGLYMQQLAQSQGGAFAGDAPVGNA